MPIFEYECKSDGIFEELLPLSRSDEPSYKCPLCGHLAERIFSTVTMRPDALWAGHMTEFGYQTSASKVRGIMKEKHHVTIGDRIDLEGIQKVAEKGRKAAQEKADAQMSKATRDFFGPSGLGIGATGKIPEQLKIRE